MNGLLWILYCTLENLLNPWLYKRHRDYPYFDRVGRLTGRIFEKVPEKGWRLKPPDQNAVWIARDGRRYRVLLVANEKSILNPKRSIVVYYDEHKAVKGRRKYAMWTLPLRQWYRHMRCEDLVLEMD